MSGFFLGGGVIWDITESHVRFFFSGAYCMLCQGFFFQVHAVCPDSAPRVFSKKIKKAKMAKGLLTFFFLGGGGGGEDGLSLFPSPVKMGLGWVVCE